MAVNTKNEDIVSKYFDLVQEEIKKLISQDKEIKPSQVETFNNEIFNQPEEIQSQIRIYIDKATMNDLDIKKIAKQLYDKFKLQVKNNVFNQDDKNDVPNPMLGERKFIKTFEKFMNEYNDVKPKWSDSDFKILIKQIEDKLEDAKEFLVKVPELKNNRVVDIKYGNADFHIKLKRMLNLLSNSKTPKANRLAEEIYMLMSSIYTFSEEQEKEISKFN